MKILMRLFSWAVTILTPLALIFVGLRLLLTPAFLQVEYRMPGFPADPYGFDLEERLYWSRYALDYLVSNQDVDFLTDLRFEDGARIFNERELQHMLDVKSVLVPAQRVGLGSWIVLIGLGAWLLIMNRADLLRGGLRRGGWLAVALVTGIAVAALSNFMWFFTVFHTFFFEGESWIFLYSDTLIRLFPVRFWQDVFIYIGTVLLVGGLILGLALRRSNSPGGNGC